MEHRNLGRTGLQVSRLSFGAMTVGDADSGFMKGVTSSEGEALRVLDRALDAGMDTIDTANTYSEGRSEELLGRWLQGKRERVVLATKCRFPTRGTEALARPHEYGLSRKAILRACEESLARLRTDYIDLYQTHMQHQSVPIDETLSALDDLVRQGKVRYVGCSNYTGGRLVESLWAADRRGYEPYASIQLQWSLGVRDAERELIPAASAFGLGVLVWSPLARGFLSGKYQRGQPAPEGTRFATWADSYRQFDNERGWSLLDTVRAVAARHGASPASVSLAWLLARTECTTIIVGARTVEQLDENLRALDLELAAADIDELNRASEPAWGYPYDFMRMRSEWP